MPVDAKTITNVVASAVYWELSTDAGCGEEGCIPALASVSPRLAGLVVLQRMVLLASWTSVTSGTSTRLSFGEMSRSNLPPAATHSFPAMIAFPTNKPPDY